MNHADRDGGAPLCWPALFKGFVCAGRSDNPQGQKKADRRALRATTP